MTSTPLDREFDLNGVRDRFDDDFDFFLELCNVFLAEFEQRRPQLEENAALRKSDAVRETAHYFKGALLNLGAVSASNAAFKLESAAREKRGDEYTDLLNILNDRVDRFRKFLAKMAERKSWNA